MRLSLSSAPRPRARRTADSWVSDVVPTETPALAQAEWEQDLAEQIEANPEVPVTEKRQIILARRGQGKFRERVSRTSTPAGSRASIGRNI